MPSLKKLSIALVFLSFICAVVYHLLVPHSRHTYAQVDPKEWMRAQIASDLKSYTSLSNEHIDYAKSLIDKGALESVFLLTIGRDGITTYPQKHPKRVGMIVKYLQKLKDEGASLPEVTFMLGADDVWRYTSNHDPAMIENLPPMFVFAAATDDPNRHRYVLLPDDHTLGDHVVGYRKGWDLIYQEFLDKRDSYPWESKKTIAFWRGLPTDNVKNYRDGRSPRVILTEISQANPGDVDASFTTVSWGNGFVVKIFRPLMQIFNIPPYVSYAQQMEYKYLPCLDGKTNTYPGLLWRLASGCLVLKQETTDQQWFYNMLTPGKDYLPLKKDMSDLIQQLDWAKAHDVEVQQIVENAKTTVEQNLTPQYIDAYIVLLINEYAKRFR